VARPRDADWPPPTGRDAFGNLAASTERKRPRLTLHLLNGTVSQGGVRPGGAGRSAVDNGVSALSLFSAPDAGRAASVPSLVRERR